MIWVTAEDVVAIHSRIIQVSGGIDGLRDRAGLEAAIAAPLQSFGGEDLFPTDIEKIARIGFGLASNHAFIDGNKIRYNKFRKIEKRTKEDMVCSPLVE